MAQVKTAISLQESLLQQIDSLADELKISRSRLFAQAAEELLERHRNQALLEALNAAYDDLPNTEDETLLQTMREKQKRLMDDVW